MAGGSRFAGAVLLGDLDDIIAPSQSCVNPLFTSGTETAPSEASAAVDGGSSGRAKVSLELDDDVEMGSARPALIKDGEGTKAAQVSLADCLACSGCVTTAEAVLVAEQSTARVQRLLEDVSFKYRVVSVAPQVLAALSVRWGLAEGIEEAFRRVSVFLRRKAGFDRVVCTALAQSLCLEETVHEVQHRTASKVAARWETPPASVPVHSKAQRVRYADGVWVEESVGGDGDGRRSGPLPLLVSACPGWVCFAEKTHPELVPYLSTVASPQQVTGALIKRTPLFQPPPSPSTSSSSSAATPSSPPHYYCPPHQVLHVSVMACFDKKLEASRLDFYDAVTEAKDVDCVITTSELLDWMEEGGRGEEGGDGEEGEGECGEGVGRKEIDGFEGLPVVEEAQSDGYLSYVVRRMYEERWGVEWDGDLPKEVGRNADFFTITLPPPDGHDGEDPIRAAAAYGFRNIQGIVNRIKRGRCEFDIVEIMACPSGCVNGGGQIPPPTSPEDEGLTSAAKARTRRKREKEHIQTLKQTLADAPVLQPTTNESVKVVCDTIGAPGSDSIIPFLHTRFHAIPELEITDIEPASATTALKW